MCVVAVVLLSATGRVDAVTWNAYGVHGATISVDSGPVTMVTAVAGDTAGQTPDFHWNKDTPTGPWATRTGQKAFYVTSDLNGRPVASIISFTWDFVSGYWGNAYFNIMVEDAGGKKAILAPAYNSAASTGWDTTVGSSTKSYCVFEAEAGWTGTASTGWHAATWEEVRYLTITDGPFTEFPDTRAGDALGYGDLVYSIDNWAAWADLAAGRDSDWEKGGVMITFGQSTGGSPPTTVIENIELVWADGFVTGAGWIDSPEGAYAVDPLLAGRANFGFVSRYKKGAKAPTGNTEFMFQVASLNFHSSSYQWLVVNQAGDNAQFKGAGTINGEGEYKFMLWAGDGEPDTFRIKIWAEPDEDDPIYDNGFDQPIEGGSILIHEGKK
ncbi:MAG: hypothetical protein ACYSW8_28880, partial [Planctomycetota bacterium]|jgi:hypothetical protein